MRREDSAWIREQYPNAPWGAGWAAIKERERFRLAVLLLVVALFAWMWCADAPEAAAAPRDEIRILQGQVAALSKSLADYRAANDAKVIAQQKAIDALTRRVADLEKPVHTFGIKPASAVRAMANPRSVACQVELDRISGLIDAAVAAGNDFIEPRGEWLKYPPNAAWGPSPLMNEIMDSLHESGYDVGLLNYYPTTFALVVRWCGN